MAKSKKKKWSKTQIKEHTDKILALIEQQKGLVKEGEGFTAATAQDIKEKFKRKNSPMIVSQWGSWTTPTAPGGILSYNIGVYNPDPIAVNRLFAHIWVGTGNIDPSVGSFLMNVDTRFPRLTNPAFPGFTLASGASTVLSFSLTVPATVEQTNYLGSCCLMQLNWLDVGTYLDRGGFVFNVT